MPHRPSLRFCKQNSCIRRMPLRQARCGFVYRNSGCAGDCEPHLGKEAADRPSIASSRPSRLARPNFEKEVTHGSTQ